MVGCEPQLEGGPELERLMVEEPRRHSVAARDDLDQPLGEALALVDLHGPNEPGSPEPSDVVPRSPHVAAGQEGFEICGRGVVAERPT